MTDPQNRALVETAAAGWDGIGLRPMKVGSLCTGYGGLDLAIHPTPPVFTADNNPDAATVINHNWPTTPNHGDLTQIDGADLPSVDVITAGFPCQPVSTAGRRQGVHDERWIWNDITRILSRMDPQPDVLLENVSGLLTANGGHAMGEVVHGLAALGYVGQYRTVAAADVGACHRRRRVFIYATPAAHPDSSRRRVIARSAHGDEAANARRAETHGYVAGSAGPQRLLPTPSAWLGRRPQHSHMSHVANRSEVTDAIALLPTPRAGDGMSHPLREPDAIASSARGNAAGRLEDAIALLPTPTAQDASGARNATANCTNPKPTTNIGRTLNDIRHADRFGEYAEAIHRHTTLIGRPAPEPVHNNRLNPPFVEWMMGLPAGWVTDADISHTAQLRVLGNGVMLQQAAHAWHLLTGDTCQPPPTT